ncbi:hypothetical protein GGI08_006972 [Coemansia sp. S2]|nr:hypothetical protein H4S03_000095 [Coemansia sp. S3946]KAJ2044897.1 hypothetical protein GGI08_006972 [Coemansia sp. S2]KAJ2353367.1 hypothetical protein GGH92_000703 [Coemansia sp. RSA 2673]
MRRSSVNTEDAEFDDATTAVLNYKGRVSPAQVRPKAAKLLGLESSTAALSLWPATATSSGAGVAKGLSKMQYDEDDARGPLLLTPTSPMSETETGASRWVPEWPEPDAAYVENLMRRRPAPITPPQHQALNVVTTDLDDPLVVWQQVAKLPAVSGIPRGADNLWHRTHGLHLPVDPLFVMQWMGAVLLTGGYILLVHPLVSYNPQATAVNIAGAVVIALSHSLSLAASAIDTQAPETKDSVRDIYFKQTWGVPVVDPTTGLCRVCCVQAGPGTRHCKRCNKCVVGLDHHCRWLNTCVGKRNYWLFFSSLVFAFLALLFVLSGAARLVYLAATDESAFDRTARLFLNQTPMDFNKVMSPPAIALVVVLAFYAVLAAAGLVSVAMLLTLHLRLCVMRMTTFEYAAMKYKQSQATDDDSSEMLPMSALPIYTAGALPSPTASPMPASPSRRSRRQSTTLAIHVISAPYRVTQAIWRFLGSIATRRQSKVTYDQLSYT